jgi:GntR family transcriptional regulator
MDRDNKRDVPLYLWVEERIREDIASGIFKEGELIPTEKELARKYGVSPGTVRRAALNLKQKGLLYRIQGKGTSVVFDEYNTLRYRNYRFVHGLNADLKTTIIAFLNLEVLPARGEVLNHLKVKKGAKVIRLERMGKIADEYLLHTLSYLPERFHRGLEKYRAEQFLKNTLWKIQEIHFKINIIRREEFLSIRPADREMAKTLEVEAGSPLFCIEAILTSSTGEVIEYRITHCNIGALRFYTCQELT